MLIEPGLRKGVATPPPSKSHLHRLLIADFLAGDMSRLAPDASDSKDIEATKRCLRALAEPGGAPVLDCGESGSTLRFMAPLAAALGKRPRFVKAGRLAERPTIEYDGIASGLHELRGDVSSQFVTGLLFALPILDGDSRIRFTTPLESRGYVDMTLAVVRGAGVVVHELDGGFDVPGGQRFRSQAGVAPEGDWSGAAFWHVANAIGNEIEIRGMNPDSVQPDRQIVDALARLAGRGHETLDERRDVSPRLAPNVSCQANPNTQTPANPNTQTPANPNTTIDVREFPDSFPVLTIAAACTPGETEFTGIRRLRIKESDRVAAMADVLRRFGVETVVEEGRFVVRGAFRPLNGGAFCTFGDHRIAMSIAIGATRAAAPVEIDDAACAAKSYPRFFDEFSHFSM